jgi:hypothetical protein
MNIIGGGDTTDFKDLLNKHINEIQNYFQKDPDKIVDLKRYMETIKTSAQFNYIITDNFINNLNISND